MVNPYKKLSKVSPQGNKGYRRVANDLWVALCLAPLSAAEFRLIFAIIHYTWGFNKTSERITYGQLRTITGINQRYIIKQIGELEAKRIIIIDRQMKDGTLPINEYMVNKFYDTWVTKTSVQMFTSSALKLVSFCCKTSVFLDTKVLSNASPPTVVVRNKEIKEQNDVLLDEKGLALLRTLGITER